jgi:hypothetical protein
VRLRQFPKFLPSATPTDGILHRIIDYQELEDPNSSSVASASTLGAPAPAVKSHATHRTIREE